MPAFHKVGLGVTILVRLCKDRLRGRSSALSK